MRQAITLSVLLAVASPAFAEHGGPSVWRALENMNTADLAATGWHQVSAAAVSDPSGVILMVTFWEGELEGARVTVKCFTRYLANGSVTFDDCGRPDTLHVVEEEAVELPMAAEPEGEIAVSDAATATTAPEVVTRPFSRRDLDEGRLPPTVVREGSP